MWETVHTDEEKRGKWGDFAGEFPAPGGFSNAHMLISSVPSHALLPSISFSPVPWEPERYGEMILGDDGRLE